MRLSLGFGLVGVALSVAIAVPLASGSVGPAVAQTVGPQKAAPSQPRKIPSKRSSAKAKDAGDGKSARTSADTDRLLDSAAKSIADGNADAAMTTLDGVLSGGGLASNHMARALYLRGVAHRRKGRPAQAIADLTSAIWLKEGLGEADRNAALKERSEVSREVGVAETAAPEGPARTESAAKPERAAEPVRVARAEPAPTAPSGLFSAPTPPPSYDTTEGGFPRSTTRSTPPSRATTASRPTLPPDLSEGGFPRSPAAGQRVATREVNEKPSTPGPSTSSWDSGTKVATKDSRAPAPEREVARAVAPPSPPPKTPPAAAPGSGSGLGDFFSGLFTGNSPAQQKPATRSAEASDWSTATRPPTAGKAAPQSKPDTIATSAAPTRTAAASGGFRLQIAAVRSRTEAESVAARVKKDHARVIGARKLEVDETVFGNMGTFYRVRLGPFAAADEPKAMCDRLRTSGYDCMVVTQ